jgi:hypothetical protein
LHISPENDKKDAEPVKPPSFSCDTNDFDVNLKTQFRKFDIRMLVLINEHNIV